MAGHTLLCFLSDFLEVGIHNAVIVGLLLVVCASIGAGLCACSLLGSSGSLTGYAGGVEKKMRLLTLENSEAAKFYR